MSRAQDVRRFPLFSHLSDALLPEVSWHDFTVGKILFQAGDRVLGVYLVDTGAVQLYRLSPEGQEQILGIVRPGESLAEWAVFLGGRYAASALCLSDTRVMFVGRAALEHLLSTDATLARKLLVSLSTKFQRALGSIEDLGLRDARGRVCRYLLNLQTGQPRGELQLPVTQSVLARVLGMRGETLSRAFRHLREEGVLMSPGRGRWTILDPTRLREGAGEPTSS